LSDLSRRAFAESLALAAVAPLLGVPPESIRLTSWNSEAELLTGPPARLAKALAQALRAQYGSRLSPKDLDTISRQIQSGLDRVDQMRKVALLNGDEPDFVFAAARHPPSSR
jgi:hypothetical protein